MQAFYALATEDYRRLALARDWTADLGDHAADRRVRLLDVACGSGRFPAALLAHRLVARPRAQHAAAHREQVLDGARGPAVVLGAVSAVGAGIIRDVLLGAIPTALRTCMCAAAAPCGASATVVALQAGASRPRRGGGRTRHVRGPVPAGRRLRVAAPAHRHTAGLAAGLTSSQRSPLTGRRDAEWRQRALSPGTAQPSDFSPLSTNARAAFTSPGMRSALASTRVRFARDPPVAITGDYTVHDAHQGP
jgi:hypothetical protein